MGILMLRRFSKLLKKKDLKLVVQENFGKKKRIELLDYDKLTESYKYDIQKYQSSFQ